MSIKINDKDLDISDAIDISIPLRFNGPQPNAYGVEQASSKPVEAGDLVCIFPEGQLTRTGNMLKFNNL